ncbi:CDP-alcohol phosphatidyltransferase family protein [Paracoccus sp. 1_MG-2023]|uniref:CDP-alcohol phosphatidyltransferase family protein n=1 Tax=unclassified Paracoccus (in: a-proteobacteria) TaxID=2688777 RepID=UPI001C09E255|nr:MULTISPECIES: CDP-alcohol phosphatidyltransferase family protein [unclassified Paracoccus (in: a-proteobacteria)]MBU2956090.1 CDP-alcohol phosphatidyltransferase family protein [Paracoccus sp. C2R09]MDO6669496.1 CDP-alcohol phosphatidyltransferase family protein [Paracoccus sp. 1_MG-2023]
MIDALILPAQRSALAPAARYLSARGIRADQLTIAGFAIGFLGFVALASGFCLVALALIAANRLMDGLDGAVARIQGPTDRGAFLDIAMDFLFYALVPLGFAIYDPVANALPAALLIAAFVGTGSSFLAFAAIAAKRGQAAAAFPSKGIYYLGGLTEGFETIALFALICIFPQAFPFLATLFAAACTVTTVLRWHQGWIAFAPDNRSR